MTSAVVQAAGRFRRYRRRRTAIFAVGFALAATAGGVAWTLVNSSAFALRQVVIDLSVNSTSSLTQREIATAAHAPIGTPLVHVNVGRIAANVASLPMVKSVSAHRQWPHAVVLDVVARRAVATVTAPDGRFLVDANGVVFDQAPAGPGGSPSQLPVIHTPGHPWTVATSPRPQLRSAVTAWQSVPAKLRADITGLQWSSAGLRFTDGRITVIWGDATEAALKATALRTVLARPAARRPHWIDVSAGGVLVTQTGHSVQ